MQPDRTRPPQIQDAIEFDYPLQPINKTTLTNGTPLYWLSAGVQDVVEIDWVFPAGAWHESKPAVAAATAGLLKNGTSKHTAHQLHERLEYYGANLKVSPGNDFTIVSLYALTKDLPELLPVVLEILTDATFPEAEVEIHKQNAIQRLLVNLRQCEFVANQRIDAMLYGPEHPYGRYSRQEKIEALTRADVVSFYRQCYTLAGVRMFMGGKVGAQEVELLNTLFGHIVIDKKPAANEPSFAIGPPTERIQHVENDAQGVQGAIRIGRIFPNRHHADFAPMVVLNTLFGGYFGSRLMSNIREDKGFTYGIYSSLNPAQHGGDLTIHTEVGRPVIDAAVQEIYMEMERLRQEAPPEEELLLVKNFLLGGLLGDLDGPFQLLQRWRTLILNDMDESHFHRNVSIYKSITAEAVQALAVKYFDRQDYYEAVVI